MNKVSVCESKFYHKDKSKIARSFSLASRSYDSVAQLQRDVADRLISLHSEYSGLWADLGCGTGYCTQEIFTRAKDLEPENLHVLGLDIAQGMLTLANEKNSSPFYQSIGADIENLPLKNESVNGLISSLSVQWSENLSQLFSEAYRTLTRGGLFLCSSLAPGTLRELDVSWKKADPSRVHVNNFQDPLEFLDHAEAQGFELIDFIKETEILAYTSVLSLMKELKALGAHNVNEGNPQGLTGKQTFKKVFSNYEQFRLKSTMASASPSVDSYLPATYQVFYVLLKKRH